MLDRTARCCSGCGSRRRWSVQRASSDRLLQQRQHRRVPEDLLAAFSAAAERQGDAPVATNFRELPVVLVIAQLQTTGGQAAVGIADRAAQLPGQLLCIQAGLDWLIFQLTGPMT